VTPKYPRLVARSTLLLCATLVACDAGRVRDAGPDGDVDASDARPDGLDAADGAGGDDADSVHDADMADDDALDGNPLDAETCVAGTCESLGAECGHVGGGCGVTLDCGACPGDLRCGADGVANRCGSPACGDSSPPLRPGIAGYQWGYTYGGASHMQGWIPFDPARLVFAGFDGTHPCALGPAGADFEVHSACGAPTSCSGANPTCGACNPCDEGSDDCGRTECGAASGGPLTPSAHRSTVRLPPEAVPCTTRTPPHPSVRCLPNGSAVDFFFVYPFGAYLYWAQNSTTKHWLHYGDRVQAYYHTRDAQGVLWEFVEVLASGAPTLTPASDGFGSMPPCSSDDPGSCHPCEHGGTCGWVQAVFVD